MSLRGSNATAAIPQTKYVILSASEISHRTIALIVVIVRERSDRGNPSNQVRHIERSEISHRTIALIVVIARHEVPRQSVGIKYGVYAANFTQGDRHACARDDRPFYCLCVNAKRANLLARVCERRYS